MKFDVKKMESLEKKYMSTPYTLEVIFDMISQVVDDPESVENVNTETLKELGILKNE